MPDQPLIPPWYVKIPPPAWTLALLAAAFILGHTFAWASVVYVRAATLGGVLSLAGLVLVLWAERLFAWAGTEVLPASSTNAHLVTGGPFRFTRNPMYLGIVLVTFAIALYAGTLPFYVVPVLVFLLCNFAFIPFEEAKMTRQFGDPYRDYTRRVRRWL